MKNRLIKFWKRTALPYINDPLLLKKWESEYSQRDDNRITSWVHSGYKTLLGNNDYTGDLYMFVEDMHLRIMPFNRYDNIEFKATITADNKKLGKIIAGAISKHDYRNDLTEGLEDFIRDSSHTLFAHSEIYFELECKHDDEGKLTKLNLHFIYPPSMKKIFGQYFQIVTWKVAKIHKIKAGIIKVPKERILHISSPRSLGGRNGLRKIVRRLASLSNIVMPDFQMKAYERNTGVEFDLDLYVKRRYMEKAILTKKYGWNQRHYQDDNILEYYSMHRYLVQANALAVFRKHILKELNKVLNNTYINAGVEIKLEGMLPTEESLRNEYTKLSKGDLKFVDLVKKNQ